MQHIIEIRAATKIYKKRKSEVVAVNNTTLNIEKGKITALLGPNGSGKTTLLKSICGLIALNKGEILVNGIDISKDNSPFKDIGCILEGERNVYYYLTVYDNLYYFGKLNRIPRRILKSKILEILEKLNLLHKKDNYVSELSRGMQQKVALAILLIKDPEIFLLDEPTLGLDVQSSIQLQEYLLDLCNCNGKTIIITTHQLDIAENISDNVILYQNGQVILNDRKNIVMKNTNHELYLEVTFNQLIPNDYRHLFVNFGKIVDDQDVSSIIIDIKSIGSILQLSEGLHINIVRVESIGKSLQDIFLQVTGEVK